MASGFGRDHPAAELLRIFAVDVNVRDPIIHVDAVSELELALQIDLNEGARVGFFCFE